MNNILGHIDLQSGPISDGAPLLDGPRLCRSGDAVIAIQGEPRLEQFVSDKAVIAGRLLDAYEQRGRQMLADIRGPFAIVIFIPKRREALWAIDRMGIEGLTWGVSDARLAVGSSAAAVAELLSASPSLNLQSLYDFMISHMVPSPATAFSEVRKLQPGTAMVFRDGNAENFRYWRPSFERSTRTDTAGLKNDVLPTLTEAIVRANPDSNSGAFLSGGLDSSTVTGLLASVDRDCANAFSVGFGVAEFDEMEFADTASRHFNCTHHKFDLSADDIVDVIPKIAATYDEPFGNSSAVPTFCCARLAADNGVTHLYAGDGGDEIFGGNERYVKQRVFEIYGRVPAALRQGLLGPIADWLDPETSVFPLRKFSSYVRQARISLPERFESWNLIYREGPARVFGEAFLGHVDPLNPYKRMKEVWDSCPSDDLLDNMLWYDWKYTLADNDLRKVSTMCELAGVRVSYPFLDEDVVDLSVRVPSVDKISKGELRSFFKQAVSGFLPYKIIRKQKHGFGLPFGQWLKEHKGLQELVYGSLQNLAQRGIFADEFLNRVASEHRGGHASYYGYAIWDLVMLEQWLQHHVDETPIKLEI